MTPPTPATRLHVTGNEEADRPIAAIPLGLPVVVVIAGVDPGARAVGARAA
ncbi:MAG: hypothetical protein WCK58_01500 [Chloroflexota bacterium]